MATQGQLTEAQSETPLLETSSMENLRRLGGGIDQEKFALAANIAMKYAEDTTGGAEQKHTVFRKWIFDICESFYEVRLTQAFVLVANVYGGDKWWFGPNGQLFEFFATGADGFRYLAIVFAYDSR